MKKFGGTFSLIPFSLAKGHDPLTISGQWAVKISSSFSPEKNDLIDGELQVKLAIFAKDLFSHYRWPEAYDQQWPKVFETNNQLDELWKQSCVECFLKESTQSSYREYHFSPWGGWNCLTFSDYRKKISPSVETPLVSGSYGFHYEKETAFCDWTLPFSYSVEGLQSLLIHPTVILQHQSDPHCYTYCAITHPNDQPDFHQASYYQLSVPLVVD